MKWTWLLLVGGIALGFYGFKEYRLAGEAKSEPQTVTLAELADKGYGSNAHVIVKDFMCLPNFVYKGDKTTWKLVYIPLAKPALGLNQFNVILKSSELRNQAAVENFVRSPGNVQGLVINKIDSLGSEEKKLLSQTYGGGFDASKCLILEHNRKPSTTGGAMGMLVGAVALVVLFVVLLVASKRQQ